MIHKISRNLIRNRRHLRIKKNLKGTKDMPRISVFRSLKQIYAQCIDDLEGRTLTWASSLDKSLKSPEDKGTRKEGAKEVGKLLGERIKELGISRIVFDRGGYKYHGRVAALAEGLREAGLQF